MEEIVLGIVALVAGFVFCFAGYRAFRLVIPIWGVFVGFATGAGFVSAITGDAVLAKPLGWLVGLFLALVFGALAYTYVAVAILLAMTSLGFLVGASVMAAIGVTWNWLITIVALVVAVVFAIVAITTNMPRIVITVVSAVAGATAMVGGAMLMFGTIDAVDLGRARVTEVIHDSWGWWIAEAILIIAGIIVQSAGHAEEDDIRAAWAAGRA